MDSTRQDLSGAFEETSQSKPTLRGPRDQVFRPLTTILGPQWNSWGPRPALGTLDASPSGPQRSNLQSKSTLAVPDANPKATTDAKSGGPEASSSSSEITQLGAARETLKMISRRPSTATLGPPRPNLGSPESNSGRPSEKSLGRSFFWGPEVSSQVVPDTNLGPL